MVVAPTPNSEARSGVSDKKDASKAGPQVVELAASSTPGSSWRARFSVVPWRSRPKEEREREVVQLHGIR